MDREFRVDLELVDIALRGAATSVCLVIALLIATSRVERVARFVLVMLIVTTNARLWSTLPDPDLFGTPSQLALRTLGVGAAFFTSWFMVAIFLDDKRYGWVWLLSGGLISAGLLAITVNEAFAPFVRGHAVLHYGAMIVLFLTSARGDLMNARRRIRPAISVILLIFAVGMSLTSSQMQHAPAVALALGHSAAFLIVSLTFAVWALKANIEHWPGETEPSTAPSPVQRAQEQTVLIRRIQAEMQAGVWQVEGLTVGALAQRVKAPEHQVRRAINQELGHRNFASFINAARIEAARARLADPEAEPQSIQEIAYDVGFASLGPFNRAFREATGLSPSDYRKQALSGP